MFLRDIAGRVLVVDPTCKEGLDLPAGMIEANEPPPAGALHELYDGGTLTNDTKIEIEIEIRDHEIGIWRVVPVDEARDEMRKHTWRHLHAAVDALATGETRYLERSPC